MLPKQIKTILIWAIFVFIIYAIVVSPERAADIVQAAWEIVWTGVSNVAEFFSSLME